MQRRAWFALTLVSTLGSWSCSSDSGSGGPRGSGGTAAGGMMAAAGGAGIGQSAGTNSVAGVSAGGAAAGGSANGGMPAAGMGGVSSVAGSAGAPPKATGTPLVYVGGSGDFPLRVYEINPTSGALTQRGGDEPSGSSPTYLALDPSGTHLYAANEDNGQAAGVTAHHIKTDGTLEPVNHQQGSDKSCGGSCGFTHVAVDPSGKFVLAADYDGGSVSVFPINQDGSLAGEKQLLTFGSNSEAHSVAFDPSGKFAFVPTLGNDQVQQLKLGSDGTWSANSPANFTGAGNSGPRHMAMHAGGKLAFLINETASTVTPFAVSADGKLLPGASVSTLPAGAKGESYGQHVKLSPDGRFLYGSNVGHDSLVVFGVDQTSGALTWLQDQPSGGAWPRDFDVDPNGELLVAANRDSNELAVFKIGSDGKLSALGQPTTVPDQPTSVVIRYQK